MNRPPKKKKKRKISLPTTSSWSPLASRSLCLPLTSTFNIEVAPAPPINDAFEEKQKAYELDATVLDEYAASGLAGLPGLDLEIFGDHPRLEHTPGDNHPFQRRLDNAASAPAAAEATYWLMLLIYRRAKIWCDEVRCCQSLRLLRTLD